MPFADDLALSELFFHHDFLDPLTQFLDPHRSFPDDPGVQPLTPSQIQRIRQGRNQKIKRLIKLWLDALPGPPVEAEQKFRWADRNQHILSEWLQPRWAAESEGTPHGAGPGRDRHRGRSGTESRRLLPAARLGALTSSVAG